MIIFRNIDQTWMLASEQPLTVGAEVTVTKRDHTTKIAIVGEGRGSVAGSYLYLVGKRAPVASRQVGNLSAVLALFERAKSHLKRPAIVLGVPDVDMTIRISVAGAQARVPGSLTVVDGARPDYDAGERRDWFGRVLLDGTYEPSRQAAGTAVGAAIEAKLVAFAADPVAVASEHGRLTGRCCFCNRALEDERSTAVGYGPVCADRFGLAWGPAKHSFKAEAVSATAAA